MNKTKIEYCSYTWNPCTGCTHGCYYCYARRIAERFKGTKAFPVGFTPTFHPDRLMEPAKVKQPSRILVCSMGDLFDEGITLEQIRKIANYTRLTKHTYLVLTKNRIRIPGPIGWHWPDNWWFGVSVTCRGETEKIYGLERPWILGNSWVSFEPLLDSIDADLRNIYWVVIGAMTGPGDIKPERRWVEKLIKAADNYNIPVFLKNNLLKLYPDLPRRQEIPERMINHAPSKELG